jgi:hypothetical protein
VVAIAPRSALAAGRVLPRSDRDERATRVVIADDEYLVREGARSVLSAVPAWRW